MVAVGLSLERLLWCVIVLLFSERRRGQRRQRLIDMYASTSYSYFYMICKEDDCCFFIMSLSHLVFSICSLASSAPSKENDKAGNTPLPPQPKMTVQTVTQSSFTFQSDIPPTSVDIHPSGILHAYRTTSPNTINNTNNNTREEHTFAWISSLSHIQSAATHLTQHGFDPSTFVFIPYSTKRNWVNRYPHAAPALECNENGEVVVFLNWRPYPNGLQEIKDEDGIFARGSSGSKKRSSSKSPANNNRNKKRKFGVELTPNSILSNPERDMLHLNIYTYFQWLQSQLVEMETTFSGKKFLGNACARVDDLGRCLGVLKETFKVIGPNVEEMFGGGGQGDFAVAAAAAAAAGGGVTTPAKKVTLEKVMGGDEAPLLEKVLGGDLSHQIEQLGKPLQEGSHTREQGDFEEYFQKLERFKEEKGHVNGELLIRLE